MSAALKTEITRMEEELQALERRHSREDLRDVDILRRSLDEKRVELRRQEATEAKTCPDCKKPMEKRHHKDLGDVNYCAICDKAYVVYLGGLHELKPYPTSGRLGKWAAKQNKALKHIRKERLGPPRVKE